MGYNSLILHADSVIKYKILEIIELDVGGSIYQEGWTNKSEATRFTQTANSAEALGDAARHAKNMWLLNQNQWQSRKHNALLDCCLRSG